MKPKTTPKDCLPRELPGVIAEMFSGPGGAAGGER